MWPWIGCSEAVDARNAAAPHDSTAEQARRIYEDGKKVASNWGQFVREWNFVPDDLFVSGVADELYVFAEPLTDETIPAWLVNWKPWLIAVFALIVIAYAPMIYNLVTDGAAFSPGFIVWR